MLTVWSLEPDTKTGPGSLLERTVTLPACCWYGKGGGLPLKFQSYEAVVNGKVQTRGRPCAWTHHYHPIRIPKRNRSAIYEANTVNGAWSCVIRTTHRY